MGIEFEITRQFEKDLASFSSEDRKRIEKSIDRNATLVAQGGSASTLGLHAVHPALPHYESTLYSLRATQRIRVILAIDDDPLFERTLITLFRVVKHDEFERALRSIAESIYQELHERG